MAIRWGPLSIFLLVLAGQALLVAAALLRSRANRLANLYLAALLVVLAGMLTPYIIGYAGFYDRYPWLSYAPFAVPLAIGPLFYAHLRALVTGEPTAAVHWLLPAAQFLSQAAVFPFPLATKNWFDEAVQLPLLSPLFQAALLVSLAGYWFAALALVRRYSQRLAGGAAANARLRRLQALLAALAVLLAARTAMTLYDQLVAPLDYFDRFAFYALLALLTGWLAIEGWRHASSAFPPLAPERDWAAQGRAWRQRLADEQWWRDPDLTLAELARRIGTNSTHLSRALNAAGPGFTELLNQWRAEDVARRLDRGEAGDLLALALEAGFGSKASFNRAFRGRFGVAPSEYRRRDGSPAPFSDAEAV